MKFRVTVVREATAVIHLDIFAESPEEAAEEAKFHAKQYSAPHYRVRELRAIRTVAVRKYLDSAIVYREEK